MVEKRYLGDQVYVYFDGYSAVLTTEDGAQVTNRIALEPAVWAKLQAWVRDLIREKETEA